MIGMEILMSGTPVGLLDVVRLEYQLGIGKMDSGIESMLAWTESFTMGVSLSSISWGFINPAASSGDSTNTKISITLHDIAGQLFNDFVKVRQAMYFVYFMAPQSSGPLMGGNWIIYQPNPDECSIEFSQTQGFTYTISGTPIIMSARSSNFTPTENITLTGTTEGVSKTGTFRDYIKELEILWNRQTKDKPTAQIEIVFSKEAKQYPDRLPIKTNKSEGNSPDFINFTVERDSLVNSIRKLWDSSFNEPTDMAKKVGIDINFISSVEGKNKVEIGFHDMDDENGITLVPTICIGDDVNCAGQIYRGQLSGINFNAIAQLLFPTDANNQDNGAAPAGSDANTNTAQPASPNATAGTTVETRKEVVNRTNSTMVVDEGRIASSWENAITMMRTGVVPEFTMSIELPYTSDFSPSSVGGILQDAVDSTVSAGIHLNQGTFILFYWYTDPLCETLELNPIISTSYRITKVTHTIGLSGNTTQVEVSHIQLR